jgi:Flp pilus assembly protein TadG
MRLSKIFRDESGSAPLEFITVGMLLLVPVVYLILAMSALQAGSLAIEGAARQAARVYVESPTSTEGRASAARAVEVALADFGLQDAAVRVQFTCRPAPRECLTRLGYVTVTVSAHIPLPLVPPGLTVDDHGGVPLTATATAQVSRFWGAGR